MAHNPNWPLSSWQANFTAGAGDPAPTVWDDLSTDRVAGYTIGAGKQFELDAVEAGTADVRCRNVDERLNPANTSSPWNTAGKSLVPYRRIRHWAAWPLAGNLVNASNDGWTADLVAGALSDTAGFEGGTIGTWRVTAGCALAPSTVRAHDGARSMLVTWAATGGGSGVADLSTPLPPLASGTVYTASVWLWINAGPAVTMWVNGNTATSTATLGAWQRLACTFTADSGIVAGIGLYAAGATTAGQQVWVDSVQVEAAPAATAWTATGPTVYPVHSGYIERYPLTWEASGFEGWAQLTAVDALALLSRVVSRDVATQDALQDRPSFLWPLADAQDAVQAANIGVLAPRAGQMVMAPMGAPTAVTTTFGGSGSPGVDSTSSLMFAPATPGDTYVPLVDWSGHTGYTVGGSAGYTFEVWFSASTAVAPAVPRAMRVLRAWGASNEETAITLDTDGRVVFEHHTIAGAIDASITTAGAYVDGGWHHVAVTASWAAGTVTEALWVDGSKAGQTTRTDTGTMVALGAMLGFDYWAGTHAYAGQMARFAVYPTALPDTRLVSHWLAARTGFAGDTTDVRIARLLAWAGWTAPTTLPAGLSRHGALTGMEGTSILDACKTAAATERGVFYAAPDGRLTLIPRSAYYQQTTAVRTFGEDYPGGETPYLDAAAELDPTYIYNEVTVTRQGGAEQVASDTVSEAAYGLRTVGVPTSHATDSDAASLAAYLVGQYADGRLRVPELSIDPAANPGLWPVALGTRFGDRVTWKRRTSAGLTVVLDGFVEHVTHEVGVDQWTAKFVLAPADTFQAGLIGDPTYGVVGSTLITAY